MALEPRWPRHLPGLRGAGGKDGAIIRAAIQKANGSWLGGIWIRLWFWPQVSTQFQKNGRRGTQGISL